MTIYLLNGNAFVDLGNYLLLICSEEEFKDLDQNELQEMVDNAIFAKKLSLNQLQLDFGGENEHSHL